jgi:redox-sensitive bicupin YhaK (pirin superfamily)
MVMLAGTVNHGDSLATAALLGAGDVQWMTVEAASCTRRCRKATRRTDARLSTLGQPAGVAENDDASLSDVAGKDIPRSTTMVARARGVGISGGKGPVDGIVRAIWISPSLRHSKNASVERRGMRSAVFDGAGRSATPRTRVPCGGRRGRQWRLRHRRNAPVRWCCPDRGDEITVQAGERGVRFLLVSGSLLRAVRHGPIVMNTQKSETGIRRVRNGTFIKHKS